jgi:hypothetical protein
MFVLIRNYYLKTGREIKVRSRDAKKRVALQFFSGSPCTFSLALS